MTPGKKPASTSPRTKRHATIPPIEVTPLTPLTPIDMHPEELSVSRGKKTVPREQDHRITQANMIVGRKILGLERERIMWQGISLRRYP